MNRLSGRTITALTIFGALPLALLSAVAQDGRRTKLAASDFPDPPIADKRISVHTLIREDVFAGFLAGDKKHLARGEKTIDALLVSRPEEKANLQAWKAGVILYHAVEALDAHKDVEFVSKYKEATEMFDEAAKAKTGNTGVNAITGGTYAILADRLPEAERKDAWERSFKAYSGLWKQQSGVLGVLPPHFKGELLGGMAMSAQRTGRVEVETEFLDRIIKTMPDSEYAVEAKAWKADPKAAAKSTTACLSCHDTGRLGVKIAELKKK